MARLQSECPDRFTEAQLRTMQRRVKEWRGIMAKCSWPTQPVGSGPGGQRVVPGRAGPRTKTGVKRLRYRSDWR